MADNMGHAESDLFAAFEASARTHSDRVALKAEGGKGKSYTYGEAADLATKLAAGLSSAEFDDAPEIGLLSENRPEWPITYLGIIGAGKTVVPIDANLKPNEIEYIVKNAQLKVIFTSQKLKGKLSEFAGKLKIVLFSEDGDDSWKHLLQDGQRSRSAHAGTTAALIYTSGTTGTPKAVMLTHGNLLANLEGVRLSLQFDQDDVFLSVLPLHHTFEATCGFLAAVTSGSTIVYARSLKSREILEDIALNGVTVMCGVPLLFEKMYHAIRRGINAAPAVRRALFQSTFTVSRLGWKVRFRTGRAMFAALREAAGLGTIRMLVSGGAPVPAEIASFFNYLGFDFMPGYGLTECSPVVSVNLPGDIRFGSVGPPLKNLEIKIDNPGTDGVGEILVKGPSVMPGYRNNAEATSKILKDGWLATGDLGKIHKGHLWITGRQKNVIVSAAGKNIYPEELEERFSTSQYVAESVVFGRKKENKPGEEVRALIVPELEQFRVEFGIAVENPDIKQIWPVLEKVVAEINAQVADYKRIDGFDVQLEELEKTSTKKVKRFMYK